MDREDELLYYVQNRLSEQGRQAFEERLATDQILAAELAVLQATRNDFAKKKKDTADLSASWAELEGRMDAAQTTAANDNHPMRLGLLQVAAVSAIAVMAWHLVAVPQFDEGPDAFETVSQESDAHVLQVVFRPEATLAETAVFLAEFEGSISDGPSAVGVYRLRFADLEQLESALQAAKDNRTLFEFVAAE
jgi:anti-sigma-K factor RskA